MLLKKKPFRSKKYLSFIQSLPCCACRGYAKPHCGVDAHHAGKTGKGIGQKCDDMETVPLCREHHVELHAIGQKTFEIMHKISFEKLISKYKFYCTYQIQKEIQNAV